MYMHKHEREREREKAREREYSWSHNLSSGSPNCTTYSLARTEENGRYISRVQTPTSAFNRIYNTELKSPKKLILGEAKTKVEYGGCKGDHAGSNMTTTNNSEALTGKLLDFG